MTGDSKTTLEVGNADYNSPVYIIRPRPTTNTLVLAGDPRNRWGYKPNTRNAHSRARKAARKAARMARRINRRRT